MKKRIEWIDFIKFICIILVMTTHFSFNNDLSRRYYHPFFLVLFFFSVGYCYHGEKSFKDLLYKKVKQLLIPWFIYSYLNIFLSRIISFKNHEPFLDELWKNLLQIRGYGDKMWFVSSLFVTYLIYYFVEKAIKGNKKRSYIYFCIFLLLYFVRELYCLYFDYSVFFWNRPDLPWRIDYIPNMILYVLLGYMYKNYWASFFDKHKSYVALVLLSLIYIRMCNIFLQKNTFIDNMVFICLELTRHVLGSLLIVRICINAKTNAYTAFVGQNTLLYYMLHNKVATLFEVFIFKFLPFLSPYLNNFTVIGPLCAIALSFLITIVLYPVIKFINKYLPWTIGRS